MTTLIIAIILYLYAIIVFFKEYDNKIGMNKSKTMLAFMLMMLALSLMVRFRDTMWFSTSSYYVEKTIKTEIINDTEIKCDTLIRIKRKNDD
jgi:hydrogenase-4 membrane subunit HyfE